MFGHRGIGPPAKQTTDYLSDRTTILWRYEPKAQNSFEMAVGITGNRDQPACGNDSDAILDFA